ncbi:MAG: DNA-3-methyladenine glycosylase [Pirellulaceae bacterium]
MKHVVLPRHFYNRDAKAVAVEMLGRLLIRRSRDGTCVGRIVEVEAYLARDDPACHACRGETRKNATMFGPPGFAYVYSIHARYCLNVVTGSKGVPSAVLIRAIEPLEGIRVMQRRRGIEDLWNTARGPARLCHALEVDRRFDGWDLTRGNRLWLADDPMAHRRPIQTGVSPRIGVTSAHDLPLRFFVDGSRFVSGPRRYHSA